MARAARGRLSAAGLVAALACLPGLAGAPVRAEEPWTRGAVSGAAGEIAAARFEARADVYPHRIMGRIREARVLAVRDGAGREWRVDLRDSRDGTRVFEDIAPRLADADGDGAIDVVVVETEVTQGAQLAVYGLRGGRLEKLHATPHIGRRFRWLAPVAIADLDRDGIPDIAYVETPHLGKRLKVWTFAPGGLTLRAELAGVTNHRIGEETISGGLRDCGAGPEMVLADAGWSGLVAVRLTRGGLERRALSHAADAAGFAAALACR